MSPFYMIVQVTSFDFQQFQNSSFPNQYATTCYIVLNLWKENLYKYYDHYALLSQGVWWLSLIGRGLKSALLPVGPSDQQA